MIPVGALLVVALSCKGKPDGDGHGEGKPSTWEPEPCNSSDPPDEDADGFSACGIVGSADCNDHDPSINPGAEEYCDGWDNDCDQLVDEDDSTNAKLWYPDGDVDGLGDGSSPAGPFCHPPDGHVMNGSDCDDTDPEVTVCVSWLSEVAAAHLIGEAEGDRAGWVASAGDVDGDAQKDLLVGAFYENTAGSRAGAVYVVHGTVRGTHSLADAEAKWTGEGADNRVSAACGLGDIDGDGLDDLLVGAPGEASVDVGAGAAYLVPGGVLGERSLEEALTKLTGEASLDGLGWAVAGPGDMDGDGTKDLVIGAARRGVVYWVPGTTRGERSIPDAASGWILGEGLGAEIAAGDIDGDGLPDLALSNLVGAGTIHIVLGPIHGTVPILSADGMIVGEASDDMAGGSMDIVDLDGDGSDDLIVGAMGESSGPAQAGAAYVVLEPLETTNLSTADAKLVGEESRDRAETVEGGDFDGDGVGDVVVGAGSSGRGAVYRVLGPVLGGIRLSDHPKLLGEDYDSAGATLAAVDAGDGTSNLLVGAPGRSDGKGAAYLMLSADRW